MSGDLATTVRVVRHVRRFYMHHVAHGRAAVKVFAADTSQQTEDAPTIPTCVLNHGHKLPQSLYSGKISLYFNLT